MPRHWQGLLPARLEKRATNRLRYFPDDEPAPAPTQGYEYVQCTVHRHKQWGYFRYPETHRLCPVQPIAEVVLFLRVSSLATIVLWFADDEASCVSFPMRYATIRFDSITIACSYRYLFSGIYLSLRLPVQVAMYIPFSIAGFTLLFQFRWGSGEGSCYHFCSRCVETLRTRLYTNDSCFPANVNTTPSESYPHSIGKSAVTAIVTTANPSQNANARSGTK